MAASASLRMRQLSVAGTGFARLLERAHFTVTGGGVLVLLCLAWLAARALGARTMFLIVYTIALVVGMSWFVARRRLSVQVSRSQLPARMRTGQTISVDVHITAKRRLSTVVVEEGLPTRLGDTVPLPIGSLKPGEELTHRYQLAPSLRGVYQVGPMVATWSDPFGFTTHRQSIADAVEVVVHPSTEMVHDRVLTRMWEDPPVRPPASKPWPVGFEFYGMRDYVPGDDLRRIVWATVAKTGRMMVRESEQGITDRIVILVDTDPEWHSPGQASDTFETAINTAASVGVRHLSDGFSVTLMTNEGPVISAARGKRANLVFLDALSRMQFGKASLIDIGQTLLDEAKSRPHLIVITPHLGSREAQQLKLVLDRGVSIVVVKPLWEDSDPTALARAAALGCQVIQIPPGASLDAVFGQQVGAGARR